MAKRKNNKKSVLDLRPLVSPFKPSERWEKDLASIVVAFIEIETKLKRLDEWRKTVPDVDDGPLLDYRGGRLNDPTEEGFLSSSAWHVAKVVSFLDGAILHIRAAIVCASGYEELKNNRLHKKAKELETTLLRMVANGDAKLIDDDGLKIVFKEKP